MLKINFCAFALLMSNLYGMDADSITIQVYNALHRDALAEVRPLVMQKSVILGNPLLLHDYLENKLQAKEAPRVATIKLLLDARVDPSYKNQNDNDALDIAHKFDDEEVREKVIGAIDLYTRVPYSHISALIGDKRC
jgi:hypothetical protein